MRKILILCCLVITLNLQAQTTPVKIVFDVTSSEAASHETTLRHVKLMSEAYHDAEFLVVIYGRAIEMVLEGHSTVSEQISSFENVERVSFKVCEHTMKRRGIKETMLLPGVKTVPDGILEIAIKQGEGWAYIKEIP